LQLIINSDIIKYVFLFYKKSKNQIKHIDARYINSANAVSQKRRVKRQKEGCFMKQSNKKAPLVFYIGACLLVMVLFSVNMTSGLYARYATEATGSAGARVAKFDVASDKKSEFSINLDFYDPAKQTASIQFAVTSSSEVAVEYDVVLVLPEEIISLINSGVLSIEMDDKTFLYFDTANNTVTFEGKSFSPNESTTIQTHTITLSINADTILTDTVKITESATLRVHAEQID
jgi:hypothetical protein